MIYIFFNYDIVFMSVKHIILHICHYCNLKKQSHCSYENLDLNAFLIYNKIQMLI